MQPEGTDRAVILILLIGEASGVFAGFCPSWFTVASPFFHEQEAKAGNVKRIRAGEVAATLIVLATGAAVTHVNGDLFPIAAAVLISVIFVGGYEYQIANPSTDDGKPKSSAKSSYGRAGEADDWQGAAEPAAPVAGLSGNLGGLNYRPAPGYV